MADESIARRVISQVLRDPDEVDAVLAALDEYDLFIAYMSRCWCDGKADGNTHTPGCAGIEQERKLRALR